MQLLLILWIQSDVLRSKNLKNQLKQRQKKRIESHSGQNRALNSDVVVVVAVSTAATAQQWRQVGRITQRAKKNKAAGLFHNTQQSRRTENKERQEPRPRRDSLTTGRWFVTLISTSETLPDEHKALQEVCSCFLHSKLICLTSHADKRSQQAAVDPEN